MLLIEAKFIPHFAIRCGVEDAVNLECVSHNSFLFDVLGWMQSEIAAVNPGDA
jgi:hypothetical protein